MAERKGLSALLRGIIGPNGHLYFDPPEGFVLEYDAVIYKRSDITVRYADNAAYKVDNRYTITYITKNPDSTIPDTLARLPHCRMSTTFVKSNLHHWVFEIYYH